MKGVKGEIDQRPVRFYKDVAVAPAGGKWAVTLDGRTLKTPAKLPLHLPSQKLADVIADEWRAQGERIDLQSMFNTRLVNVVIDRTPESRTELAVEAARYAETDLVCHLSAPGELRSRQETHWRPLRDWAAETLGVRLIAVEGILPAMQPAESIEAVRRHAAALDDFRLTGLVHAVALFGSAVIGLAVEQRRVTALEAHGISRVDEDYQESQWGQDAEAARRAERLQSEAAALDTWFQAL